MFRKTVATGGDVVERYMYDAYGKVTVLDADWSADADNASDYGNEILFAGYRHDPETGLYHVRLRPYHPTLGRWVVRDPVGYLDGVNLYQYCDTNPGYWLDPLGLAAGGCASVHPETWPMIVGALQDLGWTAARIAAETGIPAAEVAALMAGGAAVCSIPGDTCTISRPPGKDGAPEGQYGRRGPSIRQPKVTPLPKPNFPPLPLPQPPEPPLSKWKLIWKCVVEFFLGDPPLPPDPPTMPVPMTFASTLDEAPPANGQGTAGGSQIPSLPPGGRHDACPWQCYTPSIGGGTWQRTVTTYTADGSIRAYWTQKDGSCDCPKPSDTLSVEDAAGEGW